MIIIYKGIFFNTKTSEISSDAGPALLINVESGSNISIENNLRTFEGVSKNGVVSFGLPFFGQWEIHATNGPKDWKNSIIVRESKMYDINVEYYTAKLLVYVEEGAEIIARSREGGAIYEGTGLGNNIPTEIPVYYDSEYEVSAVKNNFPTNTVTVTSQDKQNTNVYLNFAKLSIKSEPGANINVSMGEYNYSIEQSSGLDIVYLPKLGNWTINIGDITKTVNVSTYKQYDITTSSYRTMTAIIDQSNSNPATCVTYADDAASMTRGSDEWDKFFGHYPCLFKDGKEVSRLNPNNFAQFEDSTSADITSGDLGDVMIAFPRRGLKIETIDNKVYVSMTDDPNNPDFGYLGHTRGEEQKEVFYVAAFEGSIKNDKLRSLSNANPAVEISFNDFRNYAHANGEGYELWTFYQWTFLQAMYVLKYANLDSQSTIGYGRCGKEPGTQVTGSTVDKGMDYGNGNENSSMKLFGIEDFYGNVWDCVDGLNSTSNGQLAIATTNFNNSEEYKIYNTSLIKGERDYISTIEGTTELGFIPKMLGGNSGSYFSDCSWFSFPSIFYVGGSFAFTYRCGVFCFYVYSGASSTGQNVGARCAWF